MSALEHLKTLRKTTGIDYKDLDQEEKYNFKSFHFYSGDTKNRVISLTNFESNMVNKIRNILFILIKKKAVICSSYTIKFKRFLYDDGYISIIYSFDGYSDNTLQFKLRLNYINESSTKELKSLLQHYINSTIKLSDLF